ncbi:helix-turn-helix domain-containing protein [Bacteroidota bacterium]
MTNAPEIIARKFLNRTNRHVFLTGKAGTGKTTFLREIVEQTHKKALIAAPTGVAAINAGGVTLHSLFQLPFGTYIPSDQINVSEMPFEANTPRTLRRHMHMHSTKRRLIQELELLIIDEVSMLRADILDAVDNVLRTVRRMREVPFGGIQILFIGDLLQLPPVLKDTEWEVLKQFYKSIHFFDSLALKEEAPLFIELEKIYRQSDPVFINLLNHFRDNKVSNTDVELLNRHYISGFRPRNNDGYIYLTTHNRRADTINREELQKLHALSISFDADVEGDFNEHQYPVEAALELKSGAQVMFIRNDASGEQRYFNGKIGIVTELSEDEIEVSFEDGSDPVWVEKHTWFNKRYKLDNSDNEIKEEITGSFTHYPLKLAWAVTVHKSQGLTFEKAIIDVEHAFAPGQIYVALSRLTSMEGLILSSPISGKVFSTDAHISAFSKEKPGTDEFSSILERETHVYVKQRLLQTFDLSLLEDALAYHLESYTKDEKRSARQRYKPKFIELQKVLAQHTKIAQNFQKQLIGICNEASDEYLDVINERLVAARDYFEPRLKKISDEIISLIEELSDAVGVKAYLKELKELESRFYSKIQMVRKSIAFIEAIRNNQELQAETYSNKDERDKRIKVAEEVSPRKRKKKKKKAQKGDSANQSYSMFKEGKSLSDIARERELNQSTIEGHMLSYIRKGDIDILEIMDEEKVATIKWAINTYYKDSVLPVKRKLGNDYTFGEIRMVLAARDVK